MLIFQLKRWFPYKIYLFLHNIGKRSAHFHIILLMIFYNVKSIIDHYIEIFLSL